MEFAELYEGIMKKKIDVNLIDTQIESSKIHLTKGDIIEFDVFKIIPELKDFYDKFENPNFYIVIKGKYDVVVYEQGSFIIKNPSSLKRCGG